MGFVILDKVIDYSNGSYSFNGLVDIRAVIYHWSISRFFDIAVDNRHRSIFSNWHQFLTVLLGIVRRFISEIRRGSGVHWLVAAAA